jgi:hypothetical protein
LTSTCRGKEEHTFGYGIVPFGEIASNGSVVENSRSRTKNCCASSESYIDHVQCILAGAVADSDIKTDIERARVSGTNRGVCIQFSLSIIGMALYYIPDSPVEQWPQL